MGGIVLAQPFIDEKAEKLPQSRHFPRERGRGKRRPTLAEPGQLRGRCGIERFTDQRLGLFEITPVGKDSVARRASLGGEHGEEIVCR